MKHLVNLLIALNVWLIPDLRAAVLPPNAVVNGKTVGEWSAECWKWIYSIPANQNPLLDCQGQWADHRQPDPALFFVAPVSGALPPPCDRTFTMPAGRYLLMPVLVITIDNIDVDPPLSISEMYEAIDEVVSAATDLYATIDGVPVLNLRSHRATSPPFGFEFLDADNSQTVFYNHPIIGVVDPII